MTNDDKALEAEFLSLMEEANLDAEEGSREEDDKEKRRAQQFHFHGQLNFEYKGELPRDTHKQPHNNN
jgi:hypothetical protein